MKTASRKLYHPRCVCENWKWYAVKHNCVTCGLFTGYTGQLHVSAYTGHLQVALRELNPLTHNDPYRGRTAPLTSKVAFYIFIQQI